MDDADTTARQQDLQQSLEAKAACRHLGAGCTCTARVGMDRSKLSQQRSQTAVDRCWGQRRDVGAKRLKNRVPHIGRRERPRLGLQVARRHDVGARSLGLSEDAAARAQPRAAARTSDVDA